MTMDSFTSDRNPWLSIPADDYEGHMNSDSVAQLSVLNQVFENALKDISPKNLAVLGCGTGNGFEHIDPRTVERVLGIDINPEYLSILDEKYRTRLPMLELSCSDLNTFTYPQKTFDLIYAALIFEYVDHKNLLARVPGWLRMNGTLVTVLHLPSPVSEIISDTPFPSLKKLETDNASSKSRDPQCNGGKIRLEEIEGYRSSSQTRKEVSGFLLQKNHVAARHPC